MAVAPVRRIANDHGSATHFLEQPLLARSDPQPPPTSSRSSHMQIEVEALSRQTVERRFVTGIHHIASPGIAAGLRNSG